MKRLSGWPMVRAAWALSGIQMRSQFQKTRLGAIWMVITVALHILIIGTLFKMVLGGGDRSYLAYFAIGYSTWFWSINIVTGFGRLWSRSSRYILDSASGTGLPVLWSVLRGVRLAGMIFPVTFAFLLVVATPSVGGVLLWTFGVLVLLGVVSAAGLAWSFVTVRSGDMTRAQSNLFHFVYLGTPIIWQREKLGEQAWIADLNPFFHLIEIVRAPLLGGMATPLNYAVSLGSLLVVGCVALILYRRYRDHIPYWL